MTAAERYAIRRWVPTLAYSGRAVAQFLSDARRAPDRHTFSALGFHASQLRVFAGNAQAELVEARRA